jgi:predicted RNase H-like HicB family nuclease
MAGDIQSSASSIYQQITWATPSLADLERDEKIRELRELVLKLSEEVNKLESIVSNMGKINMNEVFHEFTVVLHPDDNGTFVAYVPAISGCHAWGRTPEEAQSELANVFEMIKEEYEEEGKSLPSDIDLKASHAS